MTKAKNALRIVGVALVGPVIVGWAALALVAIILWGAGLRLWFWRAHATRGRRILFVYSDSPNWQAYVEERILPRLGTRAVVLNWSERRRWPTESPWEARFFRRFAGYRDFNPIALVYGRWGSVEAIRFYRPFLDAKHGKSSSLDQAMARLDEALRAVA